MWDAGSPVVRILSTSSHRCKRALAHSSLSKGIEDDGCRARGGQTGWRGVNGDNKGSPEHRCVRLEFTERGVPVKARTAVQRARAAAVVACIATG